MSFELHTNQQQVPSFEVSRWFASVLDRIDNLQNLNYLQSHWVSLEMKTFRHEIVEGRKENANFIKKSDRSSAS